MLKWPLFVSATLACGAIGMNLSSCSSVASSSQPNPHEGVIASAAVQQATSMSRLYQLNCAKCHGDSGEGGGAGTPSLLTKEKFDQKWDKPFYDAIKNGTETGMDAYGETLTPAEIWGLVVHIRELQGEALRREFGSPKAKNGVYPSPGHPYKIETVASSGLSVPWGVDWLPDGTMLVANRPGTMVMFKGGQMVGSVSGLPPVFANGQGGLMDVAVHYDYAKTGWIYLSYSHPGDSDSTKSLTKIVRGKLTGTKWGSQQTVYQFDESLYLSGGLHFGSRIVFDKKGHVFFCMGERGRGNLAQDLTKPNGKVFRVNEDGTIPKDNPFANGSKGEIKAIWSYGHRNPQGLAMDDAGRLWDTEHGPRGGDELNLIVKGANYGWPNIAHSINYNDAALVTPWDDSGKYQQPVFRWIPSIGACGLDVVRGSAFPKWKGDLVAGGLSGANVDRIRVKDGKFVEREELIHGMGRVRDVVIGPDGYIYVALNQPDKIVRIVPAN